MQARLVTIRDGELRVVDREDTEQERVELAGAEVELKRGMVEVAAGERSFFLFGYSQVNKIPPELVERAARERADVTGRDAGLVVGAFAASRELLEALVAQGARERQ